MVNRQARTPGTLREFDAYGRIAADVPAFAADYSAGFDVLARAAGSLSARLRAMADTAAAREGEAAGLTAGQRAGDAYLAQRGAETRAAAAGNGQWSETGNFAARGANNVDHRLVDILQEAARRSGFKVEAFSGFRPGDKRAHGRGAATDVRIIGKDGKALANYQSPENFGVYQEFAHTARAVQMEKYQDLAQAFRWGGYFSGGRSRYGALDLMHFDLAGNSRLGMGGGSWDRGLTSQQAAIWGLSQGAPASRKGSASLPALSGEPLALRRDGTPAGEAFDQAAIRAYSWRVEQGLSTDLAAAYDAFKDDPAGFSRRRDEVLAHYLKDESLADPQMREAFLQNFTRRSEAYRLDVAARREKALKDEEEQAAVSALDARRADLERQAFALGAHPDGDRILTGQMAEAGRAIDAAESAGTLTPRAAAERRADLAETTARARTIGVFEALPTPEEKERFATALMEDWAKGDGPLAAMPMATVQALSATLFSRARQEASEAQAQGAVRRATLKRLVDDDLASMATTGQGLDLGQAGASMADMAAALGETGFAEWTERRQVAQRQWQATAGMETLPEAALAERLAALEPKSGQPGFDERQATFDHAAKRAETLLRERTKDPAAYVDAHYPDIAALKAEARPDNPDGLQALARARLTAQDALGIDELAQSPLTQKEAAALAAPVTRAIDPVQRVQAMQALAADVQAGFGAHAEAVMRQVLDAQGIDRDLAAQGAALFSRARRANQGSARALDVAAETADADAAASPRATDAFPLPNARQETFLLSHPETADAYDAKFGPGAAARVLGRRDPSPVRLQDGGLATRTDAGEAWTPLP